MQAVMSAVAIVVRGRSEAARPARAAHEADSSARAEVARAHAQKESYFEMARHSRWT